MSKHRYLPAEWAEQSGVMLTWPHADTDWAERLDAVEPAFFAIAIEVLRCEDLLISCEDAERLARVCAALETARQAQQLPGRLHSYVAPANDTWARDHGPITVIENGQPRLLDFRFNAWGGKFGANKDDALNRHLAELGAFGHTPMDSVEFILEGGSIESDGEGVLLTTSHCLLTTTRNAELDRAGVEASLKALLGVEQILWLSQGYLAGDDTDSHIDTLARLCAPGRICYVACPDEHDEHYRALKGMEDELKAFRQRDGSPFELIPLPWPDAVYDADGHRLPATYANFLIINGTVLLPVYEVPQDEEAVRVMQRCFPNHKIVTVPCRVVIEQHGSLHCLTMQLPKGVLPA